MSRLMNGQCIHIIKYLPVESIVHSISVTQHKQLINTIHMLWIYRLSMAIVRKPGVKTSDKFAFLFRTDTILLTILLHNDDR